MTLVNGLALVVLAAALAMVSGAICGVKLGAEHLGRELAALTGAFFGPMPVVPAAVLGVIVFALIG